MTKSPDGIRVEKECKLCKKSFSVQPHRGNSAKFCSLKCHNTYNGKNRPPMSKEARKKISIARSGSRGGITMVDRICKTCSSFFKTRLAYTKRRHGKFCSNYCKMKSFKGKSKTPEHIAKISGKNSHRWEGGKTTQNNIIRHRKELRLWRKSVFERDNYTCQNCGARGGYLEAHHIKPFSKFPELRTSIENGQTLCKKCHLLTDTYGSKINNLNK